MKKSIVTLAVMSAWLLTGVVPGAGAAEPLKVGDKAPLVTGTDADGKAWKLADQVGKQIVLLYFYPKDSTPGCTKQACGWRDEMEALKKDCVQVVGVSFDSSESHKNFAEKYHLTFPLLADPEGKIVDAYGARRAEGQTFARRVSFLIDHEGKIAHITDDPSAEVHLSECKAALEKLKKKGEPKRWWPPVRE